MYALSLLNGLVSLTVNTNTSGKDATVTDLKFVNNSGRKAGYVIMGTDRSKPQTSTKDAQTGTTDKIDPGVNVKGQKADDCAVGLWVE